jgi:hypothetical protein
MSKSHALFHDYLSERKKGREKRRKKKGGVPSD